MNRRRTKKGASDSTEMVDTIGFNMRDIRKNSRSSKYTVKYMVAEINELLPENHKITEGIYYKWENEERLPTARHIPAIASVLGVSETALFHWQGMKNGTVNSKYSQLVESVKALGDDKTADIAWLASGWSGDLKALVEFDMLYASLPAEDRRDVASLGIRLYDVCRKEGRLNQDVPSVDFSYLQQALRDQHGHCHVLMAGSLEPGIQILLDQLPDGLTIGAQDDKALHTGILHQLCLHADVGVPLCKVFFLTGDRLHELLVVFCHFVLSSQGRAPNAHRSARTHI